MSWLKKGDTVGLIAPSSALGEFDLKPILDMFTQMGLWVVEATNIKNRYRYMAGTDKIRAESFNQIVKNPDIKALFCLRGGAGATRMIDMIDFMTLRENPKPIIGLSDSTALQNAAITMARCPALTGFLPLYDSKNGKIDETMQRELKDALFANKHEIVSGVCLKKGKAEGEIVGGCLSVFSLLCGTKYFPDLTDKILLLEDVGEKTYKIDLMLTQLKQQPNFDKLAGIIIGQFSDCVIKDPIDGSVDDCIDDFICDLNIPVIGDFAYGHIPQRHILPLGVKVKMTSGKPDCSVCW